ncbi:MAG: MMPL family transporter [Spirochaetales bacterium]|nr:MMPL family transporter [Spirochaetales bacterium]
MKGVKVRRGIDLLIVTVVIILTALAAVQLGKLNIDSSIEVFIPEKNQTREINDEIRGEFGASDSILLGIETRFTSILDEKNLIIIDEITQKLEEYPKVNKVISLTNMEFIESSAEGMEVHSILEGFSKEELASFRYRLNDWRQMYEGTVISRDGSLAAIIIQPDKGASEEETAAIYQYMEGLVAEYSGAEYSGAEYNGTGYSDQDLSFPMAGKPVINKEISRSVFRDVIFLVPIAAFLIIVVLFFSFRKPEGVLFPVISLAVSCIWVMGLMGFLQITFSMASILIPVLLLVVGSAYGIHIMAHFYEALATEDKPIDPMHLNKLLESETGKIRISVILAGVTTAAGFLSQLSSPLEPFRVFGIMSAAGICFSLLLTFFLIPAMIRLRYPNGLDPRKFGKIREVKELDEKTSSTGVFLLMEKIVKKGRWPIIILSMLLFGSTLLLIPRITIGTNLIEFFTADSKMVQDTEIFNEKLNGTGFISLAIRSPQKGGVLNPPFLANLENFEKWLPNQAEQVTKVQSIIPGIKRMNKIMNYDRIPYEMQTGEEEAIDFFAEEGFFSEDSFFTDDSVSAEGKALANNGFRGDFPAGNSTGFLETPILTDNPDLIYQEIAAMLKQALNSGAVNDAESGRNPEITAEALVEAFLSIKNYEGAAFDEIPEEPAKYGFSSGEELENMLSQYMILYSGSLSMMLNDPLEPDRILISIQTNAESSRDIKAVNREISGYWDYYLPEGWSYEIAGESLFNVVLSDLVARSQLISLGMALLIVWVILIILFRSVKTGSIGMIPVFFAISGIFTFMVLFGFNLDIVTSLLAALAVGIGVDYAIHFMTAYRRELITGNLSPLTAVYRTTGRAILFNASSVALGFLGLLFSRFIPIRQMGILFAVAMVFAASSALIILPMLLNGMKIPFKNIDKEIKTKEKEEWEESCSTA